MLLEAGAEPRVVFRSDETGVVQGLVGAGLGYAVVPRLTVARSDRSTRAVAVTGIPAREITLAWHADRTLSPGAEAFVEVVNTVAATFEAESSGHRDDRVPGDAGLSQGETRLGSGT